MTRAARTKPVPHQEGMTRRGLSLLEVILAVAILAGAIAALGEVTRQALESARIARDSTYAELLCESKLSEIVAGIELPDPVDGVPCEEVLEPGQPLWLYSIRLEPTAQVGAVAVYVTVYQDVPSQKRSLSCTLVRWMMDPTVDFSAQSTGTGQDSTSSQSSTTGSSTSRSSSGGSP